MFVPSKYTTTSDTASTSLVILPHIYTERKRGKIENNKSQNQMELRVTEIFFCEWTLMPPSCRSSVRWMKMDESMGKGAWQRKEQDARRAGVDEGIRELAGGKKKLGKWRGFCMVCI